MRNFFTLLTLVVSFSISVSTAQVDPQIEWQNTIGGTDDDLLYTIQQTSDGGYILGGYSESNISGDKTESSDGDYDYWVVKLDNAGVIEWQNTIGGSGADELYSVEQTSDGGYILGGTSLSGISGDKTEASLGNEDYWVVKLNSSGEIEWQNTIGGSGADYLNTVKQTSDGGYVLAGCSGSGISGDKTEDVLIHDYWVVKLNSTGGIEWQNTIGGNDYDILVSIDQTTDGGYILGGYSTSGISGDKTEINFGSDDYWVLKLNNAGAIEWQNTIAGNNHDYLVSIEQTTDGGYILGGYSISPLSGDKSEGNIGSYDYWIVKLTTSGSIQWQNTIGGTASDQLYSVHQCSDGGYFLAGVSSSTNSGDKAETNINSDYWVVKVNASGVIVWQNTIKGGGGDILRSADETSDGGFILGGYSFSQTALADKTENNSGGGDFWVIKLFPFVCNGITVYKDNDHDLYGNPSITQFSADCTVPSGYVIYGDDCNDANGSVHPGVTDICFNIIDDNCSGQADENCVCGIPSSLYTNYLTSTSARFNWGYVSGALKYKVRYKLSGEGNWTKLGTENVFKNIEGLSPNTEYVWQVKTTCRFNNPKISSDWSAKQHFTTLLRLTSYEISDHSFSVFPNPTQDQSTIHFTLSQPSHVSVKVFDMSGKEIETLANDDLEQGDHSFQFSTSSFSEGVYLVKMMCEDGIENIKLIVQ